MLHDNLMAGTAVEAVLMHVIATAPVLLACTDFLCCHAGHNDCN